MKSVFMKTFSQSKGKFIYNKSYGPFSGLKVALECAQPLSYLGDAVVVDETADGGSSITTWYTLQLVHGLDLPPSWRREYGPVPSIVDGNSLGVYNWDTASYIKIPMITDSLTTPTKLCVDHIYSGSYEGTTVKVVPKDQCSVCSESTTWADIARRFWRASTRLAEAGLCPKDDETVMRMSETVNRAIVAYFKKIHPNAREALLERLKV